MADDQTGSDPFPPPIDLEAFADIFAPDTFGPPAVTEPTEWLTGLGSFGTSFNAAVQGAPDPIDDFESVFEDNLLSSFHGVIDDDEDTINAIKQGMTGVGITIALVVLVGGSFLLWANRSDVAKNMGTVAGANAPSAALLLL